ncbi:hypothetical protein BA190_03830 [Labrys sp. WJW]|uniref:tyrosine-type recombinase/integrase n=1 Tax=Labrys sp. WJW TaxID=1737983 RepID=UPI00082B48B3|nr:site-specific integrase [Labrys sp. WJW]OCC06369.1 hypothetical protein BA190_03830 [Labrys sp. WJW]
MARKINKLHPLTIKQLTEPGRHADGNGLYLVITKAGTRNWSFMYRHAGKLREMGIGPTSTVTLAEARRRAGELRLAVLDGRDPIAEREAAREEVAAIEKVKNLPTFRREAEAYVAAHRSAWRNEYHGTQWLSGVDLHCAPINDMPVDQIGVDEVLAVLQPIWGRIPARASRIRAQIEQVLDAAKVKGLRSGENPARWRGNLRHLLPAIPKLVRGHLEAMPYADVPAFMAKLATVRGVSADGLAFLILTGVRTKECMGARWHELDLKGGLWTIPKERMKANREHRVPLSAQALEILRRRYAARKTDDGCVFPGWGRTDARPLSQPAFIMLLRGMGIKGPTPHGFRSSFRDWAAEETHHSRETAEAALAHQVGDATERAYRRADALEKRRTLMQDWADYILPPTVPQAAEPETHAFEALL